MYYWFILPENLVFRFSLKISLKNMTTKMLNIILIGDLEIREKHSLENTL